MLGSFLNTEGVFDNTSVDFIVRTINHRGIMNTCVLPGFRGDGYREEYCLHFCGTWSCMRYNDDLVIMAQGKYKTTVRSRIQQALSIVTKRIEERIKS